MTDVLAEVEALLAAHPLTAALPTSVRLSLARVATVLDLDPGQLLVEEGGVADAAFLVVAGRLSATVAGTPVGLIGRGETVGEMALITGRPRSATVRAKRRSVVIRIGAADFDSVLAGHPEAHRALTGQLVSRLEGALQGHRHRRPHAVVVAIAGAAHSTDAAVVGDRLAATLRTDGLRVVSTAAADLDDLGRLEAEHDIVVVGSTGDDLVENAHNYDKTILVVRADRPPASVSLAGITDLVLVHPDHTRVPAGTRRWLDSPQLPQPSMFTHHHLRLGSAADIGRLARRLLGRERVLVLGGGGARGLAHLGVHRALVEAGVDVDAIVGVSAGALFAACMGLDWTPDEAVERSTSILIDAGSLVDFTAPIVALSSGRRITDAIQAGFGADVDLEDLWRPLTCISADLTTLTAHLHRRGRLWRALRATVAVPGVFPPLIEDDAVLVDGGVVDNLPVVRARRLYPGATIISSDVGRRNEVMTVDLPPDGVVSGWRSLWHRVGRRRQTPTLVKLLYRLTALGGGATEPFEGDVHIRHELEGVGMFDFARARPAIDAGYQQSKLVLQAADSLLCGGLGRPGPGSDRESGPWNSHDGGQPI